MPSTSESECLVRAEKLGLRFKVRLQPPTSLRDLFAHWLWTRREPPALIEAVADVTFEIRRGDRIGILGRNGSGKTSLCRCVAGIYEPQHGKLWTRTRPRSVFGSFPAIEPELTGRENARLLACLFFGQHADRDALTREALDFSELGKLLDMPVKFYSTGMNARLVLSLVSAAPSDLLILDEVFDGADEFFRVRIGNRMLALMESSGAVLFVSHSFEQIRRTCNRLWVYESGKIHFDGAVEDGISFYRDRHAAGEGDGAAP